jgi:hypothetical protein
MRRRRPAAALGRALVFGLFVAANSPAMAAGSWVADSVTPTLRQQGRVYTSETLTPRSTTPLAGIRITSVSWRYGWSRWEPELEARLCGGERCVVLDGERGVSRAFAGLAPATPFRIQFLIPGTPRAVAPLYGEPLQLVVNFE